MRLDVQHGRTVLGVQACHGQNVILDGYYAGHGGADAVGAVLTAGGEHPTQGPGRVVAGVELQLVGFGPMQVKQNQYAVSRGQPHQSGRHFLPQDYAGGV